MTIGALLANHHPNPILLAREGRPGREGRRPHIKDSLQGISHK